MVVQKEINTLFAFSVKKRIWNLFRKSLSGHNYNMFGDLKWRYEQKNQKQLRSV